MDEDYAQRGINMNNNSSAFIPNMPCTEHKPERGESAGGNGISIPRRIYQTYLHEKQFRAVLPSICECVLWAWGAIFRIQREYMNANE